MKISALFAGIGGLELGLKRAGHETIMMCEIDPDAINLLERHFPDVPIHRDVKKLAELPKGTELVTAGFPCQDLSQVGTTNGMKGNKSSVVTHLFRLLKTQEVPNVLIENVPFMLHLDAGRAISYLVKSLERLGYRWAYRVIDARAFGLPQRRPRVFLLASKDFEPWQVLFRSNKEPENHAFHKGVACGFYWTEGNRGLGWAVDAIPPLKGGSSEGIPSPPAIWMPDGRIVTPHIRDAERLQGFPIGWTTLDNSNRRSSYRWRLIGNAVCVKTAQWLGEGLGNVHSQRAIQLVTEELDSNASWPLAAYGTKGDRSVKVTCSTWPCSRSQPSLDQFLIAESADLSLRAVSGFIKRLEASNLNYPPEFMAALKKHQKKMSARANS